MSTCCAFERPSIFNANDRECSDAKTKRNSPEFLFDVRSRGNIGVFLYHSPLLRVHHVPYSIMRFSISGSRSTQKSPFLENQ